MVELPYGAVPYPLDLGQRDACIVLPPTPPPQRPLDSLLDAALDAPIGSPRVETLIGDGARVTVIVSDATRSEPRAAFLAALRRRMPRVAWTVAIATGTHGPSGVSGLGIPNDVRIVDHDGHRTDELVELGTTTRGTPVRLHRCVVDCDLVIATGCIRPHYFAGFGAGVKAIFPGLGHAPAIRINHRWKTDLRSRAGNVDDNPCRLDLEEAVRMVPAPTFLLNGVCAVDDRVYAAVAGDVESAFRAGVAIARPWFTVDAPRAPIVIASDAPPVTASLYQAAKIAAAVAPLVEPGGALVVVAECADGIEPIDTVNEAIFRIGVLPRLAERVAMYLVSSLSPDVVARTLLRYAASVDEVLAAHAGRVVVVPHASKLLFVS